MAQGDHRIQQSHQPLLVRKAHPPPSRQHSSLFMPLPIHHPLPITPTTPWGADGTGIPPNSTAPPADIGTKGAPAPKLQTRVIVIALADISPWCCDSDHALSRR